MNRKRSTGASYSRQKGSKPTRRSWKLIAIALYITFILLSTIPLVADRTIETDMKETYEYHLRYPRDGRQTHYYVERMNTSEIGKIDLTYTTSSNSLDVKTENIKVLHVYCRSMYEDECRKVFGIDPSDNSNYYKWYFIEKNRFTVSINADDKIQELSFIDTPKPYKVIVDGEEWKENIDYFYTDATGIALSNVPSGHTIVEIYFKPVAGTPPTAILDASKTIVKVNQTVGFDASLSFDSDGTITTYFYDFGDGTFWSGSKYSHKYSKPGTYGVILMVRDNDYLVAHAYVNVTVVESSDIPEILAHVPDQVKPEDAPPWTLDLTSYGPVASSDEVEFQWYITGENNTLFTVSGENSTEMYLLFKPVDDAFGSDLTTLWLTNNIMKNVSISQPLWVNLTPVNDPPILHSVPDLILHYDDPYTFNYEPYVEDKETPRHELTLEVFDAYEEEYITINGLTATFNYPKNMVGENIFATIRISDGETYVEDVITIQVTSDYVPKLLEPLPDVWLNEGATKYNVFDLDDYFMDQDKDAIYFTHGTTHLAITINTDHTVDITAQSEWTGSELVTFRARDPLGALAEDVIVVTVLPVNDPPVIKGVPDLNIKYGYEYKFDLTPYVHDNDNPLNELKINVSDPEHIRNDIHSNMVIILNYPWEYLGQSSIVRLTVFDGLASAFQDVNVTISDNFPPELIYPLPDVVFMEDTIEHNAFDLDSYFLDANNDELDFSVDCMSIMVVINIDNTVDFTAPTDWFGTEDVYFRASDPNNGFQEDQISVTVIPVNDAPVLLPLPAQYGNESERWELDLEPYINDIDNKISELNITVENEYVVVSGSSLIFLGTHELPEQLEVTVGDGEFATSQMIDIHVKFPKSERAPTLWDLFINILPFIIIILITIFVIASVIYRKKNRFAVEEVFLIYTGGTLITHISRQAQANVDDLIFSGMFTAIQDFIKDTFSDDDSTENTWALDELKLGENKILIERTEHTYLAVIFSAEGSGRLRKIVRKLLDEIETKYAKILPTWDGDISQLKGTKEILSVLIKPIDKTEEISEPTIEKSIFNPTPKPIQPPQPEPQAQPRAVVKPVVSRSLMMARPVLPLKEHDSEQNSAGKTGLPAWRLYTERGKTITGVELNKLPIALHINPQRQIPKTIVIKKDRIILKGRARAAAIAISVEQSTLAPTLESSDYKKTVKIAMPGINKALNLDMSKSLLKQLAEFDNEN